GRGVLCPERFSLRVLEQGEGRADLRSVPRRRHARRLRRSPSPALRLPGLRRTRKTLAGLRVPRRDSNEPSRRAGSVRGSSVTEDFSARSASKATTLACAAGSVDYSSHRVETDRVSVSHDSHARNPAAADSDDQPIVYRNERVRIADLLTVRADGHAALLHQPPRFVSRTGELTRNEQ